jgi:hypothetical protein
MICLCWCVHLFHMERHSDSGLFTEFVLTNAVTGEVGTSGLYQLIVY